MSGRLATWLREWIGRIAPRCVVIVIFGDGSFLAARFSRLEPVLPRIEIETLTEGGATPAVCELAANFGSVRIYRLIERRARAMRAMQVN